MVVRTRDRGVARALDALASAARTASEAHATGDALEAIAAAARVAAGADVAVIRVLDRVTGLATARAVSAHSPALAAQLAGSSLSADELPAYDIVDLADAPPALARVAVRAGANVLLQLPLQRGGIPLGSLELLRAAEPFDEREYAFAALAAAQAALVLRALGPEPRRGTLLPPDGLELAGDALALPAADEHAPAQLLRLAAEATGARSAALWRERAREIELVSLYGVEEPAEDAAEAAASALHGGAPASSAARNRVARICASTSSWPSWSSASP